MISKQIMGVVTALGLALSAQASFVLVPDYVTPNAQSDASIIGSIQTQYGATGLEDLLRINENLGVDFGSATGFTTSSPGTGQLQVDWDLTGSGSLLSYIYIFGGSNANLYRITDAAQALVGTGLFTTPPNRGGQTPGLSHALFLGTTGNGPGEPGEPVPDGGVTLALAGLGMLTVTALRRRFGRA